MFWPSPCLRDWCIFLSVDLAIIAIYFLAVLCIGFYLKRFAQSGEDFFLAGREMTAWVAGLSFLPLRDSRARSLELRSGGPVFLPVRNPRRTLVLDWRDSGHAVPRDRNDCRSTTFRERIRCPATCKLALRKSGPVG